MPTVHINKKVFEKLVGKRLPTTKLKDRISYLGTDLESIEGDEIVVEIFPNRPDMLSEQGLARAFASFIGIKQGIRKYNIKKSGLKVFVGKEMKKVRPYTVCAIVRNLKFDDEKIREMIQVQEKLHTTFCRDRKKAAIGIYPLENIKPPIYFKAMKPTEIQFRPLESSKTMNGYEILQQHPKGKEYGYLLEGKALFPVFVDSNKDILSLTPIINSHKTGKVTEKTKEVFVEFSGFDLEYQKAGLNILAAFFADLGANVQSMEVVYPEKTITTPDLTPSKMKLDVDYVNKVLGSKLTKNQCIRLLKRMGYGYANNKVLVPAYRADIMHQVDLVEDIAIAYGYDNFKEEIPNVATIGEEDRFAAFKTKIATLMAGLSMFEVSTYHLTNKKDLIENMLCKTDYVDLEKASSTEYDILRTWMIPSLLQVLRINQHNEYPQNIFEIGTVFKKNPKTETGVEEPARLAVMIAHKEADYTEIKQILQYLFDSLNLMVTIDETQHNSFIPGRVGRVKVKDKKVAYIGELHPQVITNFGLEMPVAAFELNLTEIFKIIS